MAHKQKGMRPKHVPQRTCIACRRVGGKRGLVRLVRTENGVAVDPTGKAAGRGAYLHPNQTCWATALETRRIQQALRTSLSEEDRSTLTEYMRSLPEHDDSAEGAAAGPDGAQQ